jgi:nucleoside-diphosphate kinase
VRLTGATRKQAEEHYQHIKGKSFFDEAVSYVVGDFHREKNILLIIYYGEGAISKCRKIAGATNPEEASPDSIRGSYGRVTTKGVFENVVHVSSSKHEAEREIKLWFEPDDIFANLYPTKTIISRSVRKKVWK